MSGQPTGENEQPLNEAESARAEKTDDKTESSKTTKPVKSWCTNRTEEELNTGHAILKGVMDLDPDTIK